MQKFKKMTGSKYIPTSTKIKSLSLIELLNTNLLNGAKCIEPFPRMCAGRFRYVTHRYPIKGGISASQMIGRSLAEKNAMFHIIKKL